ncbi:MULTISPECIES: hypothetical protein [unclassified Microcoleus]|uniref:hypothetical protein n=1 Tax=unclassified Microcoleus TaxID=2642155 RepID=UPI0025E0CF10|nr:MULTISPECIES: hypothetical protein [unclassified Microcoleus]
MQVIGKKSSIASIGQIWYNNSTGSTTGEMFSSSTGSNARTRGCKTGSIADCTSENPKYP